jgi:S-adenosyl-L-methionine hydrolase (adenosine-forming)
VTLTSDVGWAYAAQMKAVLLRGLPPGSVVDLAHDLPPHDVRQAAFVVRSMAFGYPPGTVHVVVVDPGVGGRRAPLAVRCADGSLLVGPDNGVLAPLAEALGRPEGFRLLPERSALGPRVGTTFDGRDLFAPAALRLARGERPERLGRPHPIRRLRLPAPDRTTGAARGEVLHVDHFGNLITNLPTGWVPAATARLEVALGRGPARTLPWTTSYERLGRGRAGALGSSFGTVEIAVAEGRADRRFRAAAGARVRLRWPSGRGRDATRTVNSGVPLRRPRR